MLIYIADDEPLLLDDLYDAVHAAEPTAVVKTFGWAKPLLDELKLEPVKPDIAFLDIEMPGMSGMEVARELRRLSPGTRLVFATGFTQYAAEAFSIRADGYVMKPVSKEKIRAELDHLRPMLEIQPPKRIRAQCFGNFEVFADGEPMRFQYSKTRELLAYLVHRKGTLCTNGEIMAALWEDESGEEQKKDYFKKLRNDLRCQLENKGLEQILIRQHGMLGIAADEIDCDYYNWLSGKPEAQNAYQGEYMSHYSWSEVTLGTLEK